MNNSRKNIRKTAQHALVIMLLFLISLSAIACSSTCDPTKNELATTKSMVSSIIIGYENGSTIELLPGSANFNAVCDEALRVTLSIDKQFKTVVDNQTVEQLAETHQNFVYVFFKAPTEITTCMFVDEKERYHIPTNENGFRTIVLSNIVILPQGDLHEIWAGCETAGSETKCGVWESSRSMDNLISLMDKLK